MGTEHRATGGDATGGEATGGVATAAEGRRAFPWDWKTTAAVAASIVGSFYLSRTLEKLSGSALWLPVGWRTGMGIIATTLGMICFTWAKSWRPTKKGNEKGAAVAVMNVAPSGEVTSAVVVEAAAGDRKKHREHGVRRRRALLCLGLAFVCLLLYMGLRGKCVVACNVRGWVAMQETIMRSEQIDRDRMLVGSAASETKEAKSETGHDKEEGAARGGEERAKLGGEEHSGEASKIAIPDFMDVERGEIYVPMWWLIPSEQKKYIEKEGALHDRDGLGYVLDTEMDTVVDWLRREWQPALMWTTVAFATLHLAIVGLVAGGVGFAFETADAVGELIASVFLGVRHGGEA